MSKVQEGPTKSNNSASDPTDELDDALEMLYKHMHGQVQVPLHKNRELDSIPGLVNRIIQDSTSTGGRGHDHVHGRPHSHEKIVRTPILMDKLLTILLQFIKACHQQQGQQEEEEEAEMQNGCRTDDGAFVTENPTIPTRTVQVQGIDYSNRYKRRAIRWANDCIMDLIAPNENTFIPALDALLVTRSSGSVFDNRSSSRSGSDDYNYDPLHHELLKYRGLFECSSSFCNDNGSGIRTSTGNGTGSGTLKSIVDKYAEDDCTYDIVHEGSCTNTARSSTQHLHSNHNGIDIDYSLALKKEDNDMGMDSENPFLVQMKTFLEENNVSDGQGRGKLTDFIM